MIIGDGIPLAEFAARRQRVLDGLGGSIGVVFAGEGGAPLLGFWEPDWNFYYLSGIRDEQGAAILFDPRAEDPKRRCILFLRPLNPEAEDWDGYRDRITGALRKQTGFETVMRTTHLPRWLTGIARKRRRLACLHPFAVYDARVSADLAVFRKVTERCVGVALEDQTNLLPSLRALKSPAEVAVMRRAVSATEAGFRAAMRRIKPGITEQRIQRTIEEGFRDAGADGPAYNSIVGAGLSGTVLHYMVNTGVAERGDLIVIDAGARVGGYTADVTRTFPASGTFTPDQRDAYQVVLRAMEAGIRAARPGVKMSDVDGAARNIIERAGYGDAFIHGIGHQLGIEVHDVTPDGALKPGMVITVEPGVYFADRKMGIRIEDDILITRRGPENLTASIPKRIDQIEAIMGRSGGKHAAGRRVAPKGGRRGR